MNIDIIKPFCASPSSGRFALEEPWTWNGFTYATDGRIAVRVPAVDGVETPEKQPVDAQAALDQWPAVALHEMVPSPAPKEPTTCEACEGHGEYNCPHCDQLMECTDCKGTGVDERDPRWMRVDGAAFMCKYIAKIAALPGVRIGVGKTADNSYLYFEFDGGGIGVILCMVLDPDYTDSHEWRAA